MPDDTFFDAAIEVAEAKAQSFRLLPSASELLITPYDRAAATRAIDAAVARLACPRPALRFVHAPGRARGQAEQLHDGSCLVTLNLAELGTLHELAGVTFHECQHAADMAAGTFSTMSIVERERRADEFARAMQEGLSDEVAATDALEVDEDGQTGAALDDAPGSVGRSRRQLAQTDDGPSPVFDAWARASWLPPSPGLVTEGLRRVLGEIRRMRGRAVLDLIPAITRDAQEQRELQRELALVFDRIGRSVEGLLLQLENRT